MILAVQSPHEFYCQRWSSSVRGGLLQYITSDEEYLFLYWSQEAKQRDIQRGSASRFFFFDIHRELYIKWTYKGIKCGRAGRLDRDWYTTGT